MQIGFRGSPLTSQSLYFKGKKEDREAALNAAKQRDVYRNARDVSEDRNADPRTRDLAERVIEQYERENP